MYQDFLYAVKKCDLIVIAFEELLISDVELPEPYQTTVKTFRKLLPQIKNTLRYSYSNGPLEWLNNHIKVLKRNAYGFRSFYHFKLRIMIRHGNALLTKIKRSRGSTPLDFFTTILNLYNYYFSIETGAGSPIL